MKAFKRKCTFLILSILLGSGLHAQEEPEFINLSILGAVISPTKIDKTTWDRGKVQVNNASINLISGMLDVSSGIPVSTIINTIGNSAAQGTAAPDVIGYVQLVGKSLRRISNIAWTPVALANKQTRTKDSYTPMFNAGYNNWPLYKENRFRIVLMDADLFEDDPIGTVELTYDDIIGALKEGKTKWINVSTQGKGELLLIQISASKTTSKESFINGYRYQ